MILWAGLIHCGQCTGRLKENVDGQAWKVVCQDVRQGAVARRRARLALEGT